MISNGCGPNRNKTILIAASIKFVAEDVDCLLESCTVAWCLRLAWSTKSWMLFLLALAYLLQQIQQNKKNKKNRFAVLRGRFTSGIVWSQLFLFDYSLPGRAKITLACMKTKNKCSWIPPHPLLQCWWFLSVLSVQKKRSFMFAHVDDAYVCNIEVGGVGDVVWKRSYTQRALFLHDPE